MDSIIIYHNPLCGTSRNALEMIRDSGAEPTVIEYLKAPPDRVTLLALIAEMGVSVRDVLRQSGTPYLQLDLDNTKWTDDELVDFIMEHPILLNRPIVHTSKGARLCRPADQVLDLLP
jgi:arsenate reductase (glutaredoxin)